MTPSRRLASCFPKFMAFHEAAVGNKVHITSQTESHGARRRHGAAFKCNKPKNAEVSDTTEERRSRFINEAGYMCGNIRVCLRPQLHVTFLHCEDKLRKSRNMGD